MMAFDGRRASFNLNFHSLFLDFDSVGDCYDTLFALC